MLTVALAALRTRWTTLIGTFVALALGVGLVTTMGLGLASTFGAPDRKPQRFAASPVVVKGIDTLTVRVRRGPSTAHVTRRLAHPHPVDIKLLRDLAALGPVARDGQDIGGGPDAVGVDAPVAEVRRVVGDRAEVLTGDERRRADPVTARDAEALSAVNALLGTAGSVTAFVSVFVVASTFAFAVALRRREFGLLRTAGATPASCGECCWWRRPWSAPSPRRPDAHWATGAHLTSPGCWSTARWHPPGSPSAPRPGRSTRRSGPA